MRYETTGSRLRATANDTYYCRSADHEPMTDRQPFGDGRPDGESDEDEVGPIARYAATVGIRITIVGVGLAPVGLLGTYLEIQPLGHMALIGAMAAGILGMTLSMAAGLQYSTPQFVD